ncbi:hypothetical protein [Anabaena azotica]|uniref:Uncharacterized protein n=1 Tax=Anabaena azotica FACHB-119 TaxID=947527 RepID=A0ABR8DEN1_9NOST|nr:hypothetical protein [Anabaena azotica]MBD2505569.1 hypothetical protein [Anabaena azotica FACHB-119]
MKAIAAVQANAIACSICSRQSELIIMLTHLGCNPPDQHQCSLWLNCVPNSSQHLPVVGNHHADTRPSRNINP